MNYIVVIILFGQTVWVISKLKMHDALHDASYDTPNALCRLRHDADASVSIE